MALVERLGLVPPSLRQSPENPSTSLANPASWLIDAFGGSPSATGRHVSPSTALQSTAVFACVRVIAETIASLPLPVYRRLERGKARAPEHRLYRLLHDRPNPLMTSMQLREVWLGHVLLWGNSYTEIEYDGAGRVVGLWPLLPDRTTPVIERGGLRRFTTQVEGRTVTLEDWQVLHVPGLGFDGLRGYSPITMAREAVGLALAAEEYGARFFGNGAEPGGVLQHPGKLSDTARKNLRDSWEAMHRGLSNRHRVAILEEGLQWQALGVPNKDAEFLQTRKFQTQEIARLFRVPLHMIGDLERATFSNIEHQAIDFVVHTLRPWAVRFEQAINATLFSETDQRRYFAEHVIDGLLRGDLASRYSAYAVGRQWGWLSADDVRELENMNPLPDGQGRLYLVPTNMGPADQAGQRPADPARPAAQAPRPDSDDDDEDGDDVQRQRRLRLIAAEAARRVVRKEIARVRERATKLAADPDGWRAWLDEFYREHAATVAEALQLEPAVAREYVEAHRAALLRDGVGVLEAWERDAAGALTALALGG